MTLRLRRGLDIDRQSIVFAEGELVYTTDTQQIYVGDGSTVGGVRVTGSSEGSPPQLTQNLSLNGWNISGSGDISATSFTGDGSGLTNLSLGGNLTDDLVLDTNDITGSGNININGTVNALSFAGDGSGLTNVAGSFLDGVEYDISIRGNVLGTDSSVIVDYTNNTFTGNFVGDGSQLSNLPIPSIDYGTYSINIVSGDGSTILVDSTNSIFNGIFIGDGSQLSNLPGLSFVEGQEYQIDVKGNVVGLASTVLVDAFNETIPAEVLSGHATIDISGSIFGDDSTLIIDGISNIIYTNEIQHYGSKLSIKNSNAGVRSIFSVDSLDAISRLIIARESDSTINDTMVYGRLDFEKRDPLGDLTTGSIGADNLGLFFTYNPLGIGSNESEYIVFSADSNFGIGTFSPTETLDVRGNGLFSGTVTAASFKGSIVADDSTTIVDAINGTISASGFIQFGSYTDTEIAEITPSNGMVYYNTTDNRFRGYQNNAWINLDDGTTA